MVIAGIKDAFKSLAPPLTSYISRGLTLLKELLRRQKMITKKSRQEFRNSIRSLETQFVIIEISQIKQRIWEQLGQIQLLGEESRMDQ